MSNKRKRKQSDDVSEELGKSGNDSTNVPKVCMKITNSSKLPMTNPKVKTKYGVINSVLPYDIPQGEDEEIIFQGSSAPKPSGASGVVQYDIGKRSSLAIRYSNLFQGCKSGGFLWRNLDANLNDEHYQEIVNNGNNFEGSGEMKWVTSVSKNGECEVRGFISSGDPTCFNICLDNHN